MIIALVAVGFVSVGMATWVTLLSQRGRSAEVEHYASRRRLSACNTRAAIREYALTRMMTSSGDFDGISAELLSGWSSTSTAAWSGYPMESNTRFAGLNGFSPTWDYPYSKVIDVSAGTKALKFTPNQTGRLEQDFSSITSYLKTYVRSRSPVLGGDLLILHRSRFSPTVSPVVSGNLLVNGRVMHFVPELAASSYTAKSSRFIARPGASAMTLRPKDLNGSDVPPSNLAWTPITFGRSGSATDFSGMLNVVDDSSNGGNSLRERLAGSTATLQNGGGTAMSDPRGYSNDGNGTVTITPCIGTSNPADLPSIIIDNEVRELIIEGQTGTNFTDYARYRPALAIAYIQNESSVRKLQTIRLRKQNSRRMLLAIKQGGSVPGQPVNVVVEDTGTSSEWHLVIVAENTPITISANSPVTSIKVYGGIQTDGPLTSPGSGQNLTLFLENDTRGLIRLTPRAAWVETIMPDKNPGSTADNTW